MTYQVLISKKALKNLQKLSAFDNASVWKILTALSINPRPRNSIKLANSDKYRVRVGNFRIIYTIADSELIVEVIDIDHRRKVYENL
jgi:mRNA interferase RelE/StbE